MKFNITNYYKFKYLSLFFCLLIINCSVYTREQKIDPWLSVMITYPEAFYPPLVFKRSTRKDFIQEYTSSQLIDRFPAYLFHYVNVRMQLIRNYWSLEDFKKSQKVVPIKRGSQDIYQVLKLPKVAILRELPLDFDFDIKYKKIKETRGERLPLPMNYLAREFEISEGFEAGETLFSSYQLTPRMRLMSRIGLFEKWVTKKALYEEMHHMESTAERSAGDVEQFTGTIKYALGGTWDIPLKNKRKMSLEFLMQQKTNNQWHVQQMIVKERLASGVLFDHWVLTLQFDF